MIPSSGIPRGSTVRRPWGRIQARFSVEAQDRFHALIPKTGGDDCWEWKGKRFSGMGYGQFSIPGIRGPVAAHRLAYGLEYRDIPFGLFVLHRCDNPICCNPRHLFLGTALDNARDMVRKGRQHLQEKRLRHSHASTYAGDFGESPAK